MITLLQQELDPYCLYSTQRRIDLKKLIDAFVPFMRTEDEKRKLRSELNKLDGQTMTVIRNVI